MAMRSAATSVSRSSLHRIMDGTSRSSSLFARFSSDGRVLSEEERAKETVYIQKMERERLEKLKKKQEKEKAEKEKEGAEKKTEGDSH
ncbi:uncharacterized protein At2g27730, mitochondrial-like [Chenopodium quinoa]|uniref:uncharacterized protein At2g27730, mitochondrial-like n=1 Tax=Chenopodium quinoa TaxID=63459 RepID=UPI000B799FA5|nr:uncharacterized protein At2g27730, mitochondrial-like [Chenopodium quinoa]